jgi:Ca-activated chloride channel family protein
MLRRAVLPLAALALGLFAQPSFDTALAAASCATDAMLVFDGSASMSEIGFDIQENTRISDARTALHRAMPRIAPFRRIGLITYGPGENDACGNINVHFAPIDDAAAPIIDAVDSLIPKGLTPLTAAVRRASETLDFRRQPGVVVLVTDGNETCGGRPCALGEELANVAQDLTIHVIGFKVVVDFFSWDNPEQKTYADGKTVAKCLADRTGGLFVSTETIDELVFALQTTLGCPLLGHRKEQHRPA